VHEIVGGKVVENWKRNLTRIKNLLCPRCGNAMGTSATRCIHCGAEFSSDDLIDPPKIESQSGSELHAPALGMDPSSAWVLRIIGFVGGVIAAFFLEYLIFLLLQEGSGRRLMPRGVGWALFPVIVGITVGRLTPYFVESAWSKKGEVQKNFWAGSATTRFVIIAPIFWALCVGAYVLIFEPYGYQIHEREYTHMAKVILFPSGLLIVGYFVYEKLIRKPDK